MLTDPSPNRLKNLFGIFHPGFGITLNQRKLGSGLFRAYHLRSLRCASDALNKKRPAGVSTAGRYKFRI